MTKLEGVQARDCGTIDSAYSGLLRDCPLDAIQLPDGEGDSGCAGTGGSHGGVLVVVAAVVLRRRRRAR